MLGCYVTPVEIGYAVVDCPGAGLATLVDSGRFEYGEVPGRTQYRVAQRTMSLLQSHRPDGVACGIEDSPGLRRCTGSCRRVHQAVGAVLGVAGFLPTYALWSYESLRCLAGHGEINPDRLWKCLVGKLRRPEVAEGFNELDALPTVELLAALAALAGAETLA